MKNQLFNCILFCTLFVSCSDKPSKNIESERELNMSQFDSPQCSPPVSEEKAYNWNSSGSSEINHTNFQVKVSKRKIIKHGEIRFQTKNIHTTAQTINETVNKLNGYISTDSEVNNSGKSEYHIVLRVPENKFDKMLKGISNIATKIDSKNITANDVTDEFIDTEARLKTKKELELRYRELLKKCTKVSEMLEIEQEIEELRSDIEAFEGKLISLNDKVSYSTLDLTFYLKGKVEEKAEEPGFLTRLGNGISSGWSGLVSFFLGLISIWPVVLICGIGIPIIIRKIRKKH